MMEKLRAYFADYDPTALIGAVGGIILTLRADAEFMAILPERFRPWLIIAAIVVAAHGRSLIKRA